MKYTHTQTGEVWSGAPSTSRTSNFYLLSHAEKVALGWELVEEPAPTVVDLNTAKEEKKLYINELASRQILKIYPVYKQINAALGVYSESEKDTMVQYIQSVRTKNNTLKLQADNANSVEELGFEVSFE